MNKVYVPQEPAKYDKESKKWIPIVDLTPARQYGDLVICSSLGSRFIQPDQLQREIKESMRGFSQEDYIIAVGDPLAIAIAIAHASKISNGKINLLKWDRYIRMYLGVKIAV